jgi:hypothetical protein
MKSLIKICTLVFLFAASITGNAQEDYRNAIGLDLGSPSGISYKHFISDKQAIELTGGTYGYRYRFSDSGYRWYHLSAAFLIHEPLNIDIDGLESLKWYYGGGGSVYFWTWRNRYYDDRYASTSFGVQGYIGLEYTFDDIPLNLTIDWGPSIFINGFHSGFGLGYGSVGVRYVLNR